MIVLAMANRLPQPLTQVRKPDDCWLDVGEGNFSIATIQRRTSKEKQLIYLPDINTEEITIYITNIFAYDYANQTETHLLECLAFEPQL